MTTSHTDVQTGLTCPELEGQEGRDDGYGYEVSFQKFHAPPLLFLLPGKKIEEAVKDHGNKESTVNVNVCLLGDDVNSTS